jgi:hypothetical protein
MNNQQNNAHDRLIEELRLYYLWYVKDINRPTRKAIIEMRRHLSRIRELAVERRGEIFDEWKSREKLNIPGNPQNLKSYSGPKDLGDTED